MIDCKSIFEKLKAELKLKVESSNRLLRLCVIQLGDDPASNSYIHGKATDCEEIGINFGLIKLSGYSSKEEVINEINWAASSGQFTHMMVQLPIPFSKEETEEILSYIPPFMDVDGLTRNSVYLPCTPLGVMKILEEINYDLEGKTVAIINRSNLVGKPLVNLISEKNATPILCNSYTKNLNELLSIADVIVTAVGKENFLNTTNVKPHQCIIDVGITRNAEGKLCGDCSKELYETMELITPMPGGTGLFTRLMLLDNIVNSLN